jgi:hypothetical protein
MIPTKTKQVENPEYITDKDLQKGIWLHYKGHNIPHDVLLKQLKEDWDNYIDWDSDSDSEDIIEILETEEDYYFVSRYLFGEDARDHGYKFWVEFTKKHKKTYGRSTNVKFRVKQGNKKK